MTDKEEHSQYDPWTSDLSAAMDAQRKHFSPQTSGPLSQYQAVQEVLASRQRCLQPTGGNAILKCLALCGFNGLMPPQWLADAYVARYRLVVEAHLSTWDAAFGVPWPKRTRLPAARRHIELQKKVHAIVFERVVAGERVSRLLFDEIGEMRSVGASGSACEKAYYAAIQEGATNPTAIRNANASINPPLSSENRVREIQVGRPLWSVLNQFTFER